MKTRRFYNSLTSKIIARVIISFIVFMVVLISTFFICQLLFRSKVWYYNDPLYGLLLFINTNKLAVIFVCLLLGFSGIFIYYLRKSLRYIDILVEASSSLSLDTDEVIKLPIELSDVEQELNAIKQTSLDNARKALEQEAKKNELLVYLAHDLKTPLTSIIGYLSLLDEVQDMPIEQSRKYQRIALDKSNRLETLINELFEVARYNSETIILEKKEFQISLLLEQVAEEFYPLLRDKNKRINLSADGMFIYNGDPDKLARVFNNIIKNAIYYSRDDTDINILIERNSGSLDIIIENRGDKIPEYKLNKIFDKFYRADNARVSYNGGSGLGLAIARDIVELHGGKIRATSDEEMTKFIVTL